jgi:DNA-binding transcriptional ArsR family regulator
MAQRKISNVELERCFKEGNSVSQIARILGVSKGTVSKRLKALNMAVCKNVTMHYAGEVVKKEINAADQLQKINDHANELLDLLMVCVNGDEAAKEAAAAKLGPMGPGSKDPKELALKCMQEIRSQLKLQLEIFQTLYDMQAVADFQREVLQAIGDADLETRDRIIRNLQERSAIRSTLDLH